MTVVASERVVGREDELAAVERWLDRAGDAPAGLLLEGEPGIGKSTLWEAAVDRAQRRGLRVLQARPAEAERDLPFAALTDLLGELSTSGLSAPQRRALDAALRRAESATPPDPTALGLAVRVLLATTPTLLAVDDLQWLDPESVRTLSFALRRAPEPPTLVLATARSGSAAGTELSHALNEGGLSRLELGRLSLDDLAAVIRTVFDTSFTRPTLLRLWERSRGNAFFAIELLRAAQRSGGVDAAFALPTTPTLEALVASRLDLASPRAREAVAAVAALSRPTVALVTEATGAGDAEITEAVDLELLQLDGERLSVTHPLLASAAYHALPAAERRALHGRLAQLCPTPEECALHLAVATAVPDESVAATIEDAAASAARRGARSAAATLLSHSVRLTPAIEPALMRRRLREAEQRLASGDAVGARERLGTLVEELPAGSGRAEALYRLAEARWDDLTVMTDLCERALAEATDDLTRARAHRFLSEIFNSRCEFVRAENEARTAAALAGGVGDDETLALALSVEMLAGMMLGRGVDEAAVTRALALEETLDGSLPVYQAPSTTIGVVLSYIGDPDLARELLLRQQARAFEHGDEQGRAGLLLHLVCLEQRAGELAVAERYAVELSELTAQLGVPQGEAYGWFARCVVDVDLGREEAAREHAARALDYAAAADDELMRVGLRATLASLELSKGDFAAAWGHLEGIPERMRRCGWREPSIHAVHAQAAESRLGLGDAAGAAALIDELEGIARPLGRSSALAAAARCRGLLAAAGGDIDAAVQAFDRALELHEALESPLQRARTLLAAGTSLRRARRWRAARESLDAARAIFDEMGATLWAARVLRELERIGGRSASTGLTPTEARVAQLVVAGRANKEVAAELFVSLRTVESNLSRIYAKLGVRSRTELAVRLAERH